MAFDKPQAAAKDVAARSSTKRDIKTFLSKLDPAAKKNPPFPAGRPVLGRGRVRGRARLALPLNRTPYPRSHLLVDELAVGRLLPDVPDEVDRGAVALLVVGDVADDSVERHAGMHDLRDLLRIERLRLLRRLLHDLDGGVGVERVGFRIEVLRLELGDDVLRGRVVARIGTERHQRAFDARAADLSELVVGDAVA